MPQSLVQIYVHIVFSTKNRQAFLKDPAVRKELHAYLAKTCNNLDCPALEVGGVEDHVHILCRLGKIISIAELIRELKRESSKWGKERMDLAEFYWQSGYGAFSISPADVPKVEHYIQTQEERHRTEKRFRKSFADCARNTASRWTNATRGIDPIAIKRLRRNQPRTSSSQGARLRRDPGLRCETPSA